MQEILHVLYHSILDTIKIIPFLFLAFLIIEYFEHKLGDKTKKTIEKSGKLGPFLGALLGIVPQCGFSVIATNLYITRIISLGTLIAVYLSCSDEMLPILISNNVGIKLILIIILIKLFIGISCGFVIDLLLRKKKNNNNLDYKICDEQHCHCEDNKIILSVLKHTFKTTLFIFIITFILNCFLQLGIEDYLSKIFLKNSLLGPFITSLIGLIPNCASSVIITQLYIGNAISFGQLISGVLTGSGIGILVLFKSNHNLKENLKILFLLYGLGSLFGVVIELFSLL